MVMKHSSAVIVLAVSIFVGSNAVAGTNEPSVVPKQYMPVNGDLIGDLKPTDWTQGESARLALAVQMAKADFFERSMKAQDEDVRRQLANFVKKHKSSSEIGYPATAKVTNIQDYDVIEKNENNYEVSIRYRVVASVDSATFEDVFIVELGDDGRLKVIEMKS